MTRTSMPAGGRNAIGGIAGMSRARRESSILIRIRVLFPSGGRRWRGCMPSSFRHCPNRYIKQNISATLSYQSRAAEDAPIPLGLA